VPQPRKPRPGALTLPVESNLSATVFALTALRATRCPQDNPAFLKALTFLKRRQNFDDDPARRDPAYDDGGFYFIYDDGTRNKAGPAGKDNTGRQRFHSYGSTTADGVRGLLAWQGDEKPDAVSRGRRLPKGERQTPRWWMPADEVRERPSVFIPTGSS